MLLTTTVSIFMRQPTFYNYFGWTRLNFFSIFTVCFPSFKLNVSPTELIWNRQFFLMASSTNPRVVYWKEATSFPLIWMFSASMFLITNLSLINMTVSLYYLLMETQKHSSPTNWFDFLISIWLCFYQLAFRKYTYIKLGLFCSIILTDSWFFKILFSETT